jgi:hypothetical protein
MLNVRVMGFPELPFMPGFREFIGVADDLDVLRVLQVLPGLRE